MKIAKKKKSHTLPNCSFSLSNMFAPNGTSVYGKSAKNYENHTRVNCADIQLRAGNTDDDDDAGVCSPPLWKNRGDLSPTSRTRAIAKGQRELMEMARNMPESFYELSLRDMVVVEQSPRKLDEEEMCLVDIGRKSSSIKRQESKKIEKRIHRVKSANLQNGGLFLKMGIPVSTRSRRKSNSATTNKKTETLSNNKSSSSDKDWWKRRFSGSSGSESGVTGTSSTSTSSSGSNDSRRKSKGWSSGCWSFTFSKKNKRKAK